MYRLTKKEKEIYMGVIDGLSNIEIAESINGNVETVKTHIRTIFKKFDVGSRAKLIVRHYKKEYVSKESTFDSKIILKDWSIRKYDSEYRLSGKVYNHFKMPDGSNTTIRITQIDCEKMLVITGNAEYNLEEPNHLWVSFLKDEKNCSVKDYLKEVKI